MAIGLDNEKKEYGKRDRIVVDVDVLGFARWISALPDQASFAPTSI